MANNNDQRGQSTLLIVLLLLLAILLLGAGLFLTLGRQFFADDSADTPAQVEEVQPEATTAPIAGTTIDGLTINAPGSDLSVERVSGSEFGQLLPLDTELVGDVYTVANSGDTNARATLRLSPDGADDVRLVDMWGWDGSEWMLLPSTFESGELVSADVTLPQAVAAMKGNTPTSVQVGVEVLPTGVFPSAIFPAVDTVSIGSLTLEGSGALSGDTAVIQPGNYDEYLHVTNVGLIADENSLHNLLRNSALQAAHIDEIVNRAFNAGYAGVNLDYQAVQDGLSAEFSTFVTNLHAALQERELNLMVTLAAPTIVNDVWKTGGQDWAQIGSVVDFVVLEMPLNPTMYNDGGYAEQVISWATRQVHRHKLLLFLSASAIDQIDDVYTEMPRDLALSNFGALQLLQGGDRIDVGEVLEVGLSGTASALEWDGDGVTYKYTYEKNGQQHIVWLNNEGALSHRIRLATRYNLAGVLVRGLESISNGEGYTAALESLRGNEAPSTKAAALVWTVSAEDGSVVASNTSSDQFTFAYLDANTVGNYTLSVDFAFGDNQTNLGQYNFAVYDSEAERAAAAAAVEAERIAAEEAAAAAEAERLANPVGFTTIETNFRDAPALDSGIISVLDNGAEVRLLGRDSTGRFLYVRPADSTTDGWVSVSLVRPDEGVDIFNLPTIEP